MAGWRFTNYTDCIHKYIPKCMTLQGKWWDTENWWILDFSLSIPAIFFSKRHVCTSGWRGKFRLKGHLSNHDSRTKTGILFKTYWIDKPYVFSAFYLFLQTENKTPSFTGEHSAPGFKDCKCRNINKWQSSVCCWIYLSSLSQWLFFKISDTVPVTFDTVCKRKECYSGTVTPHT